MDSLFDSLRTERLQWLPEMGVGFYPVKAADMPYDKAYWDKYRGYDLSDLGARLTAARVAWVQRFSHERVVDVGIGAGRFLDECPNAFGYDVNPAAVAWINETGRWFDPYDDRVECATFWDSIEHISDIHNILRNVREWVFISTPIYKDAEHVLKSKHYRKDEHFWYFTEAGLIRFMALHGFEIVASTDFETRMGREDIGTFAFRRI